MDRSELSERLHAVTRNEKRAFPGISQSSITNTQPEEDNPIPTKVLNKISPIPILYMKQTARSVQMGTSKVLNSAQNMQLIAHGKEKEKKLKAKEERMKNMKQKVLFLQKKNKTENGVVYDDENNDDGEWEENQM